MLEHAGQCSDSHCLFQDCQKTKERLSHIRNCKVRFSFSQIVLLSTYCTLTWNSFCYYIFYLQVKGSGGCSACTVTWALLQHHAKGCKDPNCRVPHCIVIKCRLLNEQMLNTSLASQNEAPSGRSIPSAPDYSDVTNAWGSGSSPAPTKGSIFGATWLQKVEHLKQDDKETTALAIFRFSERWNLVQGLLGL